MSKRVFLIVLDSFGIGAMPDADLYSDAGANTLRSVTSSSLLDIPIMTSMGLYNIEGVELGHRVNAPTASYARLIEKSNGKDTTVGHWEIAGVISPRPLPTYPHGFPDDFIEAFEEAVDRKTVCNRPYSGTDVLMKYGEYHMMTGDLIVYTSADSVFQIAAHEEIVPLQELYNICQTARDMLTASGDHAVGRVIARPFLGDHSINFHRTSNRHDYSLAPPRKTMLDYISESGLDTIGIGKIYDIFAGQGVTETIKTKNNDDGIRKIYELLTRDFSGLAFINLVDFDMVYGHRNDIDGYAKALSHFDKNLSGMIDALRDDDILIITADHGCDPGHIQSTDHSREYVPMLIYGAPINSQVNLGTRESFADVASTICEYLKISADIDGTSFLKDVAK